MKIRLCVALAVALALVLMAGAASAEVRAAPFEDVSGLVSYDEFVASESEFRTKVVFSTDSAVKDFKFLSIMMEGWDEEASRPVFAVEELHHQAELTPDRPLVVTLVFIGDIPNNGISWVDEEGVTRRFSVGLSGYDGSIEMGEF